MKAVFVGKIGQSKLYYVLDPSDKKSDGVIVPPVGKPKVISFWDTAMSHPALKKLENSAFHQWLWQKPEDEKKKMWYRNFVLKTQPIDDRLLRGVPLNSDIMKAGAKTKSLNERAGEFKQLSITQNLHEIKRKAVGSNG